MTKLKVTFSKRILLALLALLSVLVLFPKNALAASEADLREAKLLTIGEWLGCTLGDPDIDDWFSVAIPKNGRFRVSMKPGEVTNDTTIGAGWRFEIYEKSDLSEPVKESQNVQKEYVTEWMAFAPTTFYIKVYAVDKKIMSHYPTCPYKLKVEVEESELFEKEGNDKVSEANPVNTNTVYAGSLHKKNDVDWFSYTVTKPGYQTLTLSPDANDCDTERISGGWKMIIYEADKITEIKEYHGIKKAFTSVKLPMKKGTYYIKVAADSDITDGTAPLSQFYNLKVNEIEEANWESEHNDKKEDSDVIETGTLTKGTMIKKDDVDWYKVTLDGTGKLTVKLSKDTDVDEKDVNSGWRFDVFEKGNEEAVLTKTNIGTTDEDTIQKAKGTYYIRVKSSFDITDGTSPIDQEYHLGVNYVKTEEIENSAVKLSSVKSARKKATLKWKKNEYAEGYEVYFATKKKGKYKKLATVNGQKKVKFVAKKKLKSGKTYYFKVRAFKTVDGEKIYSKDSNIKKAKIK